MRIGLWYEIICQSSHMHLQGEVCERCQGTNRNPLPWTELGIVGVDQRIEQ